MQIVVQPCTIRELINDRSSFVLNPKYQRMPVWKGKRKPLLIDSILRGYDLPKFYIGIITGPPRSYEVTDGQQRINTIFDFYDDKFPLEPMTTVDGHDVSSLKHSNLPQILKDKFLDFTLTFSEILNSDQGEVNELFIRLQKGVELSQVELRHAMFSDYGFEIDKFLADPNISNFFLLSKISVTRYKHQDYLDHVMALSFFGNTRDLKADAMHSMYKDYAKSNLSPFRTHFRNAKKIIKKLNEINAHEPGLFRNKWSFVDAFGLLLNKIDSLATMDTNAFSKLFKEFNVNRVKHRKKPEVALRSRNLSYGKELYQYILSFETEAANKESTRKRMEALEATFAELLPS